MADNQFAEARLKIGTPEGTAVFPYIDRPSFTFDKDGRYKCDLRVDPSDPEVAAFIQKVEDYVEEVRKELKKPVGFTPIKDDVDEQGNATGMKLIRAKLKAKNQRGIEQKPAVYDAAMNPLEGAQVPAIGGGSRLKMALDMYGLVAQGKVTVSANLSAVQVLDLVTYGGASSPESYGLAPVEGAYTAPVTAPDGTAATLDDSGDY